MTVGIVYRVPGLGAVLGTDSRLTVVETGEISTDSADKWIVAGSCAALYAGSPGGLWFDLREQPPRSWPELRKAIIDIDAAEHDRAYEVLAYDRRADVIWHADQSGDTVRRGLFGAHGCGGAYALGVLDASAQPRTLAAAERLVLRALKVACKRHSACGGRLRLLTVTRKGRSPVIVR